MFLALLALLALTWPAVTWPAVTWPAMTPPPAQRLSVDDARVLVAVEDPPAATLAVPAALPSLADFAAQPALPGSEGWLAEAIEQSLPADVIVEHDAFGSLIVRAAGASGPCTQVVAVGLDEPGYVVGQVRDDGYLRLRFIGRSADTAYHLAHEGRPAVVWRRAAMPRVDVDAPGHGVAPAPWFWPEIGCTTAWRADRLPAVVLVNSIHLKNPRPEALGEADLWLDVGADSAADVARQGISVLDPVALREVVSFGDRVAGPELGRRAAAHALLSALRDVPREQWRDGLALAFVAQSQVGVGSLGRGGEGLLRRLRPAQVLLLAAAEGGAAGDGSAAGVQRTDGPEHGGVRNADAADAAVAWHTLGLRVSHVGTPVECVAADDLEAFTTALRREVAR